MCDGTVGDITESGELTFTPAKWFDGSAIKIPATAADAVGEFDVTVKTSAGLGSKSATAKLEILCAWATEPDPLKAELIDGAPGSEASKNVHAPDSLNGNYRMDRHISYNCFPD